MSCLTAIELGRDLPASTLALVNEAAGTPDRWSEIDHFRPSEFAGHLEELSAAVIVALDKYRDLLGFPVYVSPANWGRHAARSYHYRIPGRNDFAWAIDIFPACDLLFAWLIAVKCSFWGGIGCYPSWNWHHKGLRGGLHLDIRRQDPGRVVWWQDQAGRMSYLRRPEEARGLLAAFKG